MSMKVSAGTLQLQYTPEYGMVMVERSSSQAWIWPVSTLGVGRVNTEHVSALSLYHGAKNGWDRAAIIHASGWNVKSATMRTPDTIELSFCGPEGILLQD